MSFGSDINASRVRPSKSIAPSPEVHDAAILATAPGTGRVLESQDKSERQEWWIGGGKSGCFPNSEHQARSHIEWIRKEKNADDPNDLTLDLDAMLKRSAELYTDPTNFLLELLQNADDNSFDKKTTPTLKVTYEEGNENQGTNIRFDCNESGFNSANVQSICRAGRSSKSRAARGTDYIGEKGLGFKSVFKVARVVWIRSGFYSFKFINDESEILGMIAPRWAKFPDDDRSLLSEYTTSILLELSPKYDPKPLVKMLKSIKPDTILFLRKLKLVKIKVIEASDPQPNEIILERLHETPTEDGMSVFSVKRGDEVVSYSVFRFEVSEGELPDEERRGGCKVSHIMLAFPIDKSTSSSRPTQQIYAFLPVRDYGFKFILQADFLLVTSRQNIERCRWNEILISKIPHAFSAAIQEFSQQKSISWLSYMPLGPYQDDLFREVPIETKNKLAKMRILESSNGELALPAELKIVPSEWPLIPSGPGRTKYISDKYPTSSKKALAALGVTPLSPEAFLSDLESFISNDQAAFQRIGPDWHLQLSSALVSLITKDTEVKAFRQKISRLNLIPISEAASGQVPLHECPWIASNHGTIFFPGSGPTPPKALGLFQVHSDIAYIERYKTWMDLLKLLEVEQYNEQKICDVIVKKHNAPSFSPVDITPEVLISHIIFLKSVRWRASDDIKVDLWFVTEGGSYQRSSSVYMDMVTEKLPFTAVVALKNKVAPEDQHLFHFLHEDYTSKLLQHDKNQQKWQVWLMRNFKLTVLPRMALVTNARTGDVTMNPDFRFLVDKHPMIVLQLLQQWWKYYEKWIFETPSTSTEEVRPNAESRKRMKTALSSMKVKCLEGGIERFAPLGQTFLPRKSVELGLKISASIPDQELIIIESSGPSMSNKVSRPSPREEVTGGLSLQHVVTAPAATESPAPMPSMPAKRRFSFLRSLFRRLFRRLPKKKAEEAATPTPELVISQPTPKPPTPLPTELPSDIALPTSRLARGDDVLDDENNTWSEAESEITPPKWSSKLLLCMDKLDPEEKSWDFLEHLGVVVRIRVDDCLRHLRLVKGSDSVTRESVGLIYEHIEQCAEPRDFELIRQTFMTENLVFTPPDKGKAIEGQWVSLESCVWDGPECLKKTPRLKKFYEPRTKLFLEILKCLTAELPALVLEAQKIDETSDLQHIKNVFAAICGCLDPDPHLVSPLRELKIFPTRQGLEETSPHKLQTALDSEEWYIPDKPRPAQVFGNKLNFLAFPLKSLSDCNNLFELFDIQHRLISVAAQETVLPDGDVQRELEYEKWLKKRIHFVLPLVANAAPDTSQISLRLKHIQVLRGQKVAVRWTIKMRESPATTCQLDLKVDVALIVVGDEELHIHLSLDTPGSAVEQGILEKIAIELSEFCGISNDEHRDLLKFIVTQQNLKSIGDRLQALKIVFEQINPEEELDIGMYPSWVMVNHVVSLTIYFSDEVPIANENPAIEKSSTVRSAIDEISAIEAPIAAESLVADEIPTIEPPIINESLIIDEISTIEQPTSNELSVSGEASIVGHLITDESSASYEPPDIEIPIGNEETAPDEPVVSEDLIILDETPARAKPPITEHSTMLDQDPATNELSSAKEGPSTNGVPTSNLPIADENSAQDKIPNEDESPGGTHTPDADIEVAAALLPKQGITVPAIVVLEALAGSDFHSPTGISPSNNSKPDSPQSTFLDGDATERIRNSRIVPKAPEAHPEDEMKDPQSYPIRPASSLSIEQRSSSGSKPSMKFDTTETNRGDVQHTGDEDLMKLGETARQQIVQTWSTDKPDGHESGKASQADIESGTAPVTSSVGSKAFSKGPLRAGANAEDPEPKIQKGNETPKPGLLDRGRPRYYQQHRESSPSVKIYESEDQEEVRSRPRSSHDSFVGKKSAWIPAPTPISPNVIFSGEDTKVTKFFGELYVSQFLQKFYEKDVYDPNKHWTSVLRSRNGHTPFSGEKSSSSEPFSTFTIPETGGKLTDTLTGGRHVHTDDLEGTVTFHLEVCSNNGGLSTRFKLSNPQLEKLKKMTIKKNKKSKDVYILVRVYKVHDDPGIAMYANPWQLHLDGSILLESQSGYDGRVAKSTPIFLAEEFASAGLAADTHEIYKGLKVELDQIRLLRLELENDDNKPLKGTLEVYNLANVPAFWAISYVWGPKPSGPSPATFETENGQINITESLASCLRSLRRRGVTDLIWADALCINQKNDIEKSMQVRRMGSLYQKAKRVIIWLGDRGNEKESNRVIDELAKAHMPFCTSTSRCRKAEGMSATNSSVPDVKDSIWNEVNDFLERPWFTRTWIVQELVLSLDVDIMCGTSEMKWDCFMESLRESVNGMNERYRHFISDNDRFLVNSVPAFALHLTRERHKHKERFDFLTLLEQFSYTRSSKARDKLFALQNMAHDISNDDPLFSPVYDSSEEEVLDSYARGFVSRGQALELMYRAGSEKSTIFCSWIPNFIHRQGLQEFPPTISTWKAGETGFYAGRHDLPQAKVSKKGENPVPVLNIKGHIIDEVKGCFPLQISTGFRRVKFAQALDNMRNYTSYLTDYPGASSESLEGSGIHPNNELMLKTLIGDAKGPLKMSNMHPLSFMQGAQPVELVSTWKEDDLEKVSKLDLHQDARKYKETVTPEELTLTAQFWQTAAAFTGRIPSAAFFTTKKYAGVAPGAAQPGDVIFIADGGKVPFILRKKPLAKHYTLIGESYIHGIMYSPPPDVESEEGEIITIV